MYIKTLPVKTLGLYLMVQLLSVPARSTAAPQVELIGDLHYPVAAHGYVAPIEGRFRITSAGVPSQEQDLRFTRVETVGFKPTLPVHPLGYVDVLDPLRTRPSNLGYARRRIRCFFTIPHAPDAAEHFWEGDDLRNRYPYQDPGDWSFVEDRERSGNPVTRATLVLSIQLEDGRIQELQRIEKQVDHLHILPDGPPVAAGYYCDGMDFYQASHVLETWQDPWHHRPSYTRNKLIKTGGIPTHADKRVVYVTPFQLAGRPVLNQPQDYIGFYRFFNHECVPPEINPQFERKAFIYSDGHHLFIPYMTHEVWSREHGEVGLTIVSYGVGDQIGFKGSEMSVRLHGGLTSLPEGLYRCISKRLDVEGSQVEYWQKMGRFGALIQDDPISMEVNSQESSLEVSVSINPTTNLIALRNKWTHHGRIPIHVKIENGGMFLNLPRLREYWDVVEVEGLTAFSLNSWRLELLLGPSIRFLELKGGSDTLSMLARANLPFLSRLHLRSCIGPAGAQALARAAAHWPHLSHLDLSNNEIGPEGVQALAGEAPHWSRLNHLDLKNNKIGPGGAQALAGAVPHWLRLSYLDLSNNKIGPAGVQALAGTVAHWPHLSHLDLNANGIGPEGATALAIAAAHWPRLSRLNLSNNEIGPLGVQALAEAAPHWPCLSHLNLDDNKIGITGAQALAGAAAHLSHLSHLDLCGNQIDSAGAQALAGAAAHWSHLSHLDLCGNEIGAAGAQDLAGAAAHWPHLNYLNLRYNEIGLARAQDLVSAAAIHWPSLSYLSLEIYNDKYPLELRSWRALDVLASRGVIGIIICYSSRVAEIKAFDDASAPLPLLRL